MISEVLRQYVNNLVYIIDMIVLNSYNRLQRFFDVIYLVNPVCRYNNTNGYILWGCMHSI